MCLAIPGKILSIGPARKAEVDFGGVTRCVQLDLVPAAANGDYVIVHAGYAIEKLSKEQALETLEIIKEAFGA
jgi:hydrogenase expression/formation protein HypC